MGKEAFDKMIEQIINNQYDLKRIAANMGYDEEWWFCCMVKKGEEGEQSFQQTSCPQPLQQRGASAGHPNQQ